MNEILARCHYVCAEAQSLSKPFWSMENSKYVLHTVQFSSGGFLRKFICHLPPLIMVTHQHKTLHAAAHLQQPSKSPSTANLASILVAIPSANPSRSAHAFIYKVKGLQGALQPSVNSQGKCPPQRRRSMDSILFSCSVPHKCLLAFLS